MHADDNANRMHMDGKTRVSKYEGVNRGGDIRVSEEAQIGDNNLKSRVVHDENLEDILI